MSAQDLELWVARVNFPVAPKLFHSLVMLASRAPTGNHTLKNDQALFGAGGCGNPRAFLRTSGVLCAVTGAKLGLDVK